MTFFPSPTAIIVDAPNALACLESVTIAPHQELRSCTMLGRMDVEPFDFAALDFTADDGRQNAAAVVSQPVTTLDKPAEASVITRGPCMVRGLIWPAHATAEQIAAGRRQLARLGITQSA